MWILTTPLSVGDLDVAPYDRIKIIRFVLDRTRDAARVTIEYGRLDGGGEWVAGLVPASRQTDFVADGAAFSYLAAHLTNNGETTLAAIERAVFEWLANAGHIDAGAIS